MVTTYGNLRRICTYANDKGGYRRCRIGEVNSSLGKNNKVIDNLARNYIVYKNW